jgi:hypothetical protein
MPPRFGAWAALGHALAQTPSTASVMQRIR